MSEEPWNSNGVRLESEEPNAAFGSEGGGLSALPNGWVNTCLSEVMELIEQKIPDDDEIINYIDISSVDRENKRIVTCQELVGRKAPSRARRVVKAGDVLVSMTRPSLNAVAIVPDNLANPISSPGFEVLRCSYLDHRWLFAHVRSSRFIQEMSELVQGALYPAIRPGDIKNYEFALPSRNEQTRIADKLDQTLAIVERARARLDRVPEILKCFRQSVLAAATDGRLTEDWREENFGTSEPQWLLSDFGSLIKDGPKNGLYKPASVYGDGTRILRIDMFYEGQVLPWDRLRRLDISDQEKSDYALQVMDIVINRVNSLPYLGKAALIRSLPEPCVFESNMMRLRLDISRLNPGYCIHFLCSPEGIKELRKNAKHAVNQASINQGDVKSVAIPLPSLVEQAEIVRRVESLFALADRIEARHREISQRVERLTQALLAKAFRGELVPQDPDDEPAEQLLARLRAAREAEPTETTRPRRGVRRNKA